jgi:hypothetical protein
VIGARTDEQLADNLAAAELELSAEERARLDEVSAPPLLYPVLAPGQDRLRAALGPPTCHCWAPTWAERFDMPRTSLLPGRPRPLHVGHGHEPVIAIDDGDTVVVETRDVSDNQIGPDSDAERHPDLDWDRVYPLAGPIQVNGAEPATRWRRDPRHPHARLGVDGDPARPRAAADDFPDAYLRDLRHQRRRLRLLRDDIAIPLAPFFGTMGVCPAGASDQAVMPPGTSAATWTRASSCAGRRCTCPVAGAGRDVQLRRRARLPGRRRGVRDGPRGPMYGALRFTLEKGRSIPRRSTARGAR